MMNRITSAFFGFSVVTLAACGSHGSGDPAATASSRSDNVAMLKVDNLADEQKIAEGIPTQFRISAKSDIDAVEVFANGRSLGKAQLGRSLKQFRFSYTFQSAGDQDLTFTGFANGEAAPLAQANYRVHVVRPESHGNSRLFNPYILKAVDYLNKNYGLLGYNINSQITHPINYSTFGTFKPTGNGMTMCVAGTLEVIMTAFDIYSKETGDFSIYDFLSFKSWSTLDPTTIKAQIWVDPKLHSSGTADAITHFGIGEHVKFKDLQPGSFININRTTGSGHSVTFLSFIDIKGNDVPEYNDSVVGFRYFGSQGHGIKGQGGFSFRHAFFSKYGCPDVPYQRDCNVILSDDQKLLNVGQMLDPSLWKHPSVSDQVLMDMEGGGGYMPSPANWDGLTTDD